LFSAQLGFDVGQTWRQLRPNIQSESALAKKQNFTVDVKKVFRQTLTDFCVAVEVCFLFYSLKRKSEISNRVTSFMELSP
jgi:hypothetical protein